MKGLTLFLLSAQLVMIAFAASVKNQQVANTEWWAEKVNVRGESKARRTIHSLAIKQTALNPQIIGGSVATLGQFPWHGWLKIYDATGSGFLCGCSLIADRWALTAGHCIALDTATKKYTHDVVLGTIARSSPSTGFVTKTSTPYRHEQYETTNFNDIALLYLASAVTFTDNIKAIALPTASVVTDAGTIGIVSGFGRTSDSTQTTSNVLKYAELPIVSNDVCTTAYTSSYEPENMICARATQQDQADCQGDSGGPYVLNAAAADATQVGIVSFGGESCLGTPSVYTRVSAYLNWISTKKTEVESATTTTSTSTTKGTTTKSTTTKKPTTTKTTTTKKPTTPKPANCLSANYKDMKTCCSPAGADLVAPIKGYKSCTNSAGFVAFNTFGLNKLQNTKSNNSISLSSINETILKIVWKESSFVSCFLNESGVFVDGEIDTDALTTLLTKNQDTSGPWVDIITEAVTTCSDIISAYDIPTSITYNKVTFDIRGYLMVQCVLLGTIEGCPTRVTSKTPCVNNYKLFDQCKGWFFAQSTEITSSAKRKAAPKPRRFKTKGN
ncbi:transmembrane protease serine 9-like [Neocloeon triangulifer]|uniref:transmembrane protease serine 9-like n=1 Tax=Neocloeon triangulifer TaxID=2078957 RepID=UPI00286EE071|nr:transmembrane protease serine 9-like [Neocloeon triangulifer]